MKLDERLILLRKKAGLSQEKLAEKLDISRQAVSKWESGATNPDINNVISLSEIYGVSTDYILLGKEDAPSAGSDAAADKADAKVKRQFHLNGFLWLGLGLLCVLALYFATNLF